MSELAFNVNGEPFDVPPTMAAWRVRKLKPKGAPEVVYGRDGLPLFLPMDADIDDLRRESRADGRYRLDPVDDHNRGVPNAQASYVCVHPAERASEPVAPAAPPVSHADTTAQLIHALLESQKQHTEMARMYVSQFPVLVNALSGVVRAAGDAGLPARVPLVVPVVPEATPNDKDDETDDDQDDSDEPADDSDEIEGGDFQVGPEPKYSWPRVAQAFLERVDPYIGPLFSGVAGLSMLGANRAKRPPGAAPVEATAPSAELPAFDMSAHVNSILAALTPAAREFAQAMVDEIPSAELPAWLAKLRDMSVPEAVVYVRARMDEGAVYAAKLRAANTPDAPASRPVPPVPSLEPSALAPGRREGQRRMGPTRTLAPAATAVPLPAIAPAAATPPSAPTATTAGIPLLDQATQSHFAAIQRALTPDEDAALRARFATLPAVDRARWIARLLVLSVTDAAAEIRAELHLTHASVPVAPEAHPPRNAAPTSQARAENAAPREEGPAPVEAPSAPPTPSEGHPVAADPVLATAVQPVSHADPSAHLAAIENALSPEERMLTHTMIAGLSPTDRDTWTVKLLSMSVADGTATLRDAVNELLTHELNIEVLADTRELDDGEALDEVHDLDDSRVLEDVELDIETQANAAEIAAPRAPSPSATSPRDARIPEQPQLAAPKAPVTVVASGAAPPSGLPTLDPEAQTHFKAIYDALTLAERMRVHDLGAQLPPAELRAWYAALVPLSVADAVTKIRAALAPIAGASPGAMKRGVS